MPHSAPHSRSQSIEETPQCLAYQLILDHVLTYPATFEIPLRTMYALNCAPQMSHPKSHHSASSTSSAGSLSGHSPTSSHTSSFQDRQATQTFSENLMAQIAQCSHQPTSLPPSFIIAFLRRCFSSELVCVDFTQALTGLDYLKDLETRRRREVSGALARLGVDRHTLQTDPSVFAEFPSLEPWTHSVEAKERRIEVLYTQLYVGLRRWILINELSLLPFNKHNCVAMLNTLYPPMRAAAPTSKLSHEVLRSQREGFFKYINLVEKSGPDVLASLQKQGAAIGDDNGWMAISRALNQYLQLATSVIYECSEIVDVADIEPKKPVEPVRADRPARKVDSGISFASKIDVRRPSSRDSDTPPMSPTSPTTSIRPKLQSAVKGGTALEKLARGLRTIGRSRVDATEIINTSTTHYTTATTTTTTTTTSEKHKGLRKMRSLGSLDRALRSAPRVEYPAFDLDEARRQRLRSEAVILAEQKFGHHKAA